LKRADPAFPEEAILMRALRDFNTPKIPNNDIPIFLRLIADLFPGLDLQPKLNESLHKTCTEVCKVIGLRPEETFISKSFSIRSFWRFDTLYSCLVLRVVARLQSGRHCLNA